MAKIDDIVAREILDSRGNPTIECDILLEDSSFGRASVPSGASTGKHEAIEIRDRDPNRYFGKGVKQSLSNIQNIKSQLKEKDFSNIDEFDSFIKEIDGTLNKSNLGANSTLALSISFVKALSSQKKQSLYEYLSNNKDYIMPVPLINIINGGAHADNNIDFQEFMIAPVGAPSFSECIRYGSEIFHSLKKELKSKGLNTNIGDEGGFAPNIKSTNEALELISKAVLKTGLQIKKDIVIALDIASTEFYRNNEYHLKGENKTLSTDQMIDYLKQLTEDFPIFSIEDGLAEDDWEGWQILTQEIGDKIQLVGDDLFVTNLERLKKGIDCSSANSILIKLNQIGTVSETLSAIKLAKKNNFSCIISHRSGETEDTTISDLAVGTCSNQIKTGSVNRTDRTAKYNQLLRIEEKLEKKAIFAGRNILKD